MNFSEKANARLDLLELVSSAKVKRIGPKSLNHREVAVAAIRRDNLRRRLAYLDQRAEGIKLYER